VSNRSVCIVFQQNPLSHDLLRSFEEPGISLAEALGEDANRTALYVEVEGEYISAEEWENRILRENDQVLIRRRPKGGGGFKDALRAALTIGLALFAVWLTGGTGLLAGLSAWQAAGVVIGITLVGQMAINALLPPPSLGMDPGSSPKSLSDLRPANNTFRQWAPVPVLYGKMRIYPPYAAMPWTELLGGEQYIHCLFVVGMGIYTISDAKLGETPLDEYEGVDLIQTTQPGVDRVFEETVNISLDEPLDPGFVISSTTHHTNDTADFISIDIVLPAGLIYTANDGERRTANIDFRVEFRLVSDSVYTNVRTTDWEATSAGANIVLGDPGAPVPSNLGILGANPSNVNQFRASGKTIDPQRLGLKWPTPAPGEYVVRVARSKLSQTEDVFDGSDDILKYQQEFTWTVIRSFSRQNAVVPSLAAVTYLDLRIRATNQLSQQIDTFSVLAERHILAWNPTTSLWESIVSRNATWAWVDILCGQPNARPVDKDTNLALDDMVAWADRNTAAGRYYDRYVTEQNTVYELQREPAACGRAALTMDDGKYSVIEDFVDMTPVQVFTPRNSRNFHSVKTFPEEIHALRVRFLNEAEDYGEDEAFVYNDGYSIANATKFVSLSFPGVTNFDQLWKLGRYHLAALKLRPEIYEWEADLEAIVCQRGDVVRCQSDVTLWGVGSGRIRGITTGGGVTTVFSDERFTIAAGPTYYARVRRDDGTLVVSQITIASGFNVDSFIWLGAEIEVIDSIKTGNLFTIGELNLDSQLLVIQGITWSEDRNARITAVDLSSGIDLADTGEIPPFDTGISFPPDPSEIAPPAPIIVDIRADDGMMLRNAQGILVPRVVISFRFDQPLTGFATVTVVGRYRPHDDGDLELAAWAINPTIANANEGALAFSNVEPGIPYDFQIQSVSASGLTSAWVSAPSFTVTVPNANIVAVAGLAAAGQPSRVRLDINTSNYDGREQIESFIVMHNIVNDREDPDTHFERVSIPIPITLSNGLVIAYVNFNDTATHYFWVAPLDKYGKMGANFPTSPTAGVSATPQAAGSGVPGDDALFYYIKALNGTMIKNGVGSLTIEAHKILGAVDTHLTSGSIKMYDESNVVVGNGYTATLDAGDIDGSMVVSLKDAPAGAILDTISLLDIADGTDDPNVVYAGIVVSNGLAWVQAPNGGAWTPSGTTTDLTAKFYRGGILVATHMVRVTLDTSTGELTAVDSFFAETGEPTTANIFNPETGALTIEFIHDASLVNVSETVIAARSGSDGVVYYIKPLNGTSIKNHTGTLTIEAHKITGVGDTHLSSGSYQMFKPDNSLAGNGYTWTADSTAINGSIVITLKSGTGGTPRSTITLVDIEDGDPGQDGDDGTDAVMGAVEANNGIAWRRDTNGGAWVPVATTTDLTCRFWRGGVNVATRVVRITRDVNGLLTQATQSQTGEGTTHTQVGGGTAAITITFKHTASSSTVAQTVVTVQGGNDGQDGGDATQYYIKPLAGTAIKNGVGTLSIEAHKITGNSDVVLSSGTIKMYKPNNTVAGNGYVWSGITAADITGEIIVTLKDGSGGTPLDTITLIDVTDGLDSLIASVEPSNGLAWHQNPGGTWSPGTFTTDLTCRWYRAGAQVAMREHRVTLEPTTGNLTQAHVTNSGEATTVTAVGGNTSTITLTFAHTATNIGVSETVVAVQSPHNTGVLVPSVPVIVLYEKPTGVVLWQAARGRVKLMVGDEAASNWATFRASDAVHCTVSCDQFSDAVFDTADYDLNSCDGSGGFTLSADFPVFDLYPYQGWPKQRYSVWIPVITVVMDVPYSVAMDPSYIIDEVANGANTGPTVLNIYQDGGVPQYTWAMRRISGSTSITAVVLSNGQFQFHSSGTNTEFTATFVADVRDAQNRLVTSPGTVTVTRRHGSFGTEMFGVGTESPGSSHRLNVIDPESQGTASEVAIIT
jgi:sulfur carrier protein ThiS